MKVPFRHQATEYDCVPTSLINGLCYLFSRRDLPPFVVQRVYKDCLDYGAARGTTSQAIRDMGHWLSCYKENRFDKFAIASNYICGNRVHLRRSSRIIRCLDAQGAAIMIVHTSRFERHCILGIRMEDEWLYCYDPYPRTRRYIDNVDVQFVESNSRHGPNLRIRSDWLENDFNKTQHADERKYVFGNIENRECLLLNRIRR